MADQPVQVSGFQVASGAAEKYDRYVSHLMRPFVAEMVARTVQPATRVLDVACGTGFATQAAAETVGPNGAVVGVDINSGMVEKAKTRSMPAGVSVEWHVGSALALPFEDGCFDTVLCQQGVQFFPSPTAGLADMRRVLRVGGSLGVTVWAPIEESPYLYAQMVMLRDHCGMDPHLVTQAFPPVGALQNWAREAGWSNSRVETLRPTVALPSLDRYIVNHLSALPWSAPFFALSADEQSSAVTSMIDSLHSYIEPDGTAAIPTASLLLTAVGG